MIQAKEFCEQYEQHEGSIVKPRGFITKIPVDDIADLIRTVAAEAREEQDREIERLRIVAENWQRISADWHERALKCAAEPYYLRVEKAEARIKELEQELLWAAEACEKAEDEMARLLTDNAHKDHDLFQTEKRVKELQHYNEVLKSQRADVYNEGVEDGKRQAENLLAGKEKV